MNVGLVCVSTTLLIEYECVVGIFLFDVRVIISRGVARLRDRSSMTGTDLIYLRLIIDREGREYKAY